MLLDIIPYSLEKNLGKAYNEAMALAPDDSHVCLRDGDTCWLTADYGVHLAEYVRLYPNSVLTCWTNRINEKAEQQYNYQYIWNDGITGHGGHIRECVDMRPHLLLAEDMKKNLYSVTPLHGFVSGFCLVIPKRVWLHHKFSETQVYSDRGPTNMLGVDNDFTNRIRAAGIQVLRMDGMYIWHTYRLLQGDHDKKHLL